MSPAPHIALGYAVRTASQPPKCHASSPSIATRFTSQLEGEPDRERRPAREAISSIRRFSGEIGCIKRSETHWRGLFVIRRLARTWDTLAGDGLPALKVHMATQALFPGALHGRLESKHQLYFHRKVWGLVVLATIISELLHGLLNRRLSLRTHTEGHRAPILVKLALANGENR